MGFEHRSNPFSEGAPAVFNVEFSPVCLGFAPFRTSEATPTSIGHLVQFREVGIENHPLCSRSEGDPLCAVFWIAIGHLVDIQIW